MNAVLKSHPDTTSNIQDLTAPKPIDRSILGTAISRDDILIVAKTSTLKWDMTHLGLSQNDLLARYRAQGECGDRILSSHLRQTQVLKDLTDLVSSSQIVAHSKLTKEMVSKAKLVIALGGDDHLKAISHWIDDDTILVGVNSDPLFSEGVLTCCGAADLSTLLDKIERGDYRLQPWQRLRVSVNGTDFGPALSEVVLAKQDFRLMTKHFLEFNGEKVMQRSSGLIVCTGAGSTGWYTSAGLYLAPEGRSFDPTSEFARFELREPYVRFEERDGKRKAVFPDYVDGQLEPGASLKVTSLNNSQGIVSRDSIDTIPFNRGAVAEIRIDEKPLWVIGRQQWN